MIIEFAAGRKRIKAYLAVPEGGDVPGVLVIHAWWGLNSFFKGFCERLADAGFVALAPDLYHDRTASSIDEAKRLRSQLKSPQVKMNLDGALEYLRSSVAVTGDRFGVVGFSLGATLATALALRRTQDIKAVVLFYGIKKGEFKKARAAFLGHFAENDQWTPAETVRQVEKQMRLAGKDVTFYNYPGTKHWFFEDDRADSFNEGATILAWNRTVEFLHRQLGE